MTQLAMSGVGVSFGATKLLDDVTFTVAAGDKWGVVGRNGAGKTTLFRLITGVMEPTRGQVTRIGGLRISLLEQHRDFGDATTVWEAAARPLRPGPRALRARGRLPGRLARRCRAPRPRLRPHGSAHAAARSAEWRRAG